MDPSTVTATHQTLTTFKATFVICGALAGIGVLSIPRAFANAGWVGIPVVIIIGIVCAYTGHILSKSWLLLQEQYPEYRTEYCRYPYPALGERTLGIWGRRIISININLSSFGAGTVFMVVAAQNIQAFVHDAFGPNLTLCWYLLIVGAIFVPVTWLESPKDFWLLGFGAYAATFVVLILVVIVSVTVYTKSDYVHPPYASPTFGTFFQSFGNFMFAYGVHSMLLSAQLDMREQLHYSKSIWYAFFITILSYLPVPLLAYVVFGSNVEANVLFAFPAGVIKYLGLLLVTGHVLLASNITWNVLYQEAEHVCGVKPHGFSIRRVCVRSALIAAALFVALTLPDFGPLLDLVGSITNTSLIFLFPPVCYYIVCNKVIEPATTISLNVAEKTGELVAVNSEKKYRDIPMWEKVFLVVIIVIGIMGMIASTYFSLYELLKPGTFYSPCYVDWYHLTIRSP